MNFETLAQSPYISLTTYRKDGSPVATPIWVVSDGSELIVWTSADSWKVKRINNNPRVSITPCSARGRISEGANTVEGTARVLDLTRLHEVRDLLAKKYRWSFRAVSLYARFGEWTSRREEVGGAASGQSCIAITIIASNARS